MTGSRSCSWPTAGARQDIAADLGVDRRTVTRWLNTYCADRLGGLRPKKPKGKAGHIPTARADEIKTWVLIFDSSHRSTWRTVSSPALTEPT